MKRKLPGLLLLTVLLVLAGCRVANRGKDVILAAAAQTIVFALDRAAASAPPSTSSSPGQLVPNHSKQCHKRLPEHRKEEILITRSV